MRVMGCLKRLRMDIRYTHAGDPRYLTAIVVCHSVAGDATGSCDRQQVNPPIPVPTRFADGPRQLWTIGCTPSLDIQGICRLHLSDVWRLHHTFAGRNSYTSLQQRDIVPHRSRQFNFPSEPPNLQDPLEAYSVMAPSAIFDNSPSPPASTNDAKPTVYLLDRFHPEAERHAQELFNVILPGTPEHSKWRQNAHYLLIKGSYLTAEDVELCPNLQAIGKQGVGIDKIDAAACEKRGIQIFNTPGVNARAVAELVLSLTTSVARDIPALSIKQHSGVSIPKAACNGIVLHKKTLGIIGMGNIGKTVAKIFQGAFEAPLVAYDPYAPADTWSDLPHTRATSVEEVLQGSDVVTLHVPLTNSTQDLIAYKELAIMKRDAILVNASRGGIVNEAALEQALTEGLIWGAGLDCHEQEPPTKEKYEALWSQRVVSTPHIGAATSQTQKETAVAAVDLLHQYIVKSEGSR